MKKCLCTVILITVLLGTVTAFGSQSYTGVVTPSGTSTYAYITFTDIYGNYAYIARPGQIIKPQITDIKGDVVKDGTLVLQQDMRYWIAVLDQYKSMYLQSLQNLKLTQVESKRFEKMFKTKACSLGEWQNAQNSYYNAIIANANAKAAYEQYKFQTYCYTDVAPFEGIVTKNMAVIGQLISGAPAVAVSQLNPIGINVKMDREAAKSIGNNTPVKIYPMGLDKPQGIIYGSSVLTDDGIMFITENYPVVKGTEVIPDKTDPVAIDWFPVRRFLIDGDPSILSVARSSLVKEGDKYYVWKAKGQKTMDPNKAIDNYFQIEKVYVVPEDMMRTVDNFEKKVALKDKGTLELYDITMANPDKDLKDGQTVLYPEGSYLLMPGDQVKVEVGN